MVNQNENGLDLECEGVSLYDAGSWSWGHSTFVEWSELESEGYMKDDSIILEIEFDFKYYDFSKNIPNYTDIIIIVQGTKFYVNKELLCSKSEYFYNKFIIEKSDEKELTIENVKIEDFRYFITFVFFFFESVKVKHYEQLMKLADKFKTPEFLLAGNIFRRSGESSTFGTSANFENDMHDDDSEPEASTSNQQFRERAKKRNASFADFSDLRKRLLLAEIRLKEEEHNYLLEKRAHRCEKREEERQHHLIQMEILRGQLNHNRPYTSYYNL